MYQFRLLYDTEGKFFLRSITDDEAEVGPLEHTFRMLFSLILRKKVLCTWLHDHLQKRSLWSFVFLGLFSQFQLIFGFEHKLVVVMVLNNIFSSVIVGWVENII